MSSTPSKRRPWGLSDPVRNALLPLLVSVTIYMLFRSKAFAVIHLFHLDCAKESLTNLQLFCQPLKALLPAWILYSLPDGLWTYAFTAYFVCRLRNDPPSTMKVCYLLLTPTLSITFETAQYFHLLPGTFDLTDLALNCAGALLPFLLFHPGFFAKV